MKTKLTLFLIFLGLGILGLNAQPETFSVGHSTHLEDQVFQGPCYVFATTAAIESIFKQQENQELNFSEWYFWSDCVAGGGSTTCSSIPISMLPHTIEHGMVLQDDYFEIDADCPCVEEDIPPFSPKIRCRSSEIGEGFGEDCNFNNFCEEGQSMMYDFDDVGCYFEGCEQAVIATSPECIRTLVDENGPQENMVKIDLLIAPNGTISPAEKRKIATAIHENQSGVIVCFSDYHKNEDFNNGNDSDRIPHSIFVYGYTGFNSASGPLFRFKDSWPGDPEISIGDLNSLGKMSSVSWLDLQADNQNCGTNSEQPEDPECGTAILNGPDCFKCYQTANYSVTNAPAGSIFNWQVGPGLSIESGQGTSQITVSTSCFSLTKCSTVEVSYHPSCNPISTAVSTGVLAPTGIDVLSPNWNLQGETCPNEILELSVVDQNDQTCNYSYIWNIQGATILSGQGTNTLFVKTSSNVNTYLNFSVRASNSCSNSPWFSLSGMTIKCKGGGDGQLRASDVEVTTVKNRLVFKFTEGQTKSKVNYQLYNILGRVCKSGILDNDSVDLSGIDSGVYFLHAQIDGQIFNKKIFIP